MILIYASLPVDPDSRTEALDAVRTLVERSTEEAGVIEYRASIDITDKNTVQFF